MYRFILCFLAVAFFMTACNKSQPTDPGTSPDSLNAHQAAQEADIAKPAQDAREAKPAQDKPEATAETAEQPKPAEPEQPALNTQLIIGDKEVTFPAFAIDVKLDDAAKSKLTESNETIIVAAYLSFYEEQKSPKQYRDYVGEDGSFLVAEKRIELKHDMTRATFDQITCSREIFDIITDEDKAKIEVLINIFSGRKAFQNNLLDCDILQEKINDVAGKSYTLACKLI